MRRRNLEVIEITVKCTRWFLKIEEMIICELILREQEDYFVLIAGNRKGRSRRFIERL